MYVLKIKFFRNIKFFDNKTLTEFVQNSLISNNLTMNMSEKGKHFRYTLIVNYKPRLILWF